VFDSTMESYGFAVGSCTRAGVTGGGNRKREGGFVKGWEREEELGRGVGHGW